MSDEQEHAMDSKTFVNGSNVAPHVVRLTELVACQETAVVSRTLLKRDTGSVTLFAFAADQGLSEHTAPFDAMVQVLQGEVTVRIDGKPFRLGAGDAIVMLAHRPHALQAITAFKMVLTMLR